MLRVLMNVIDEALLIHIERPLHLFAEQFGKPDHRVERRPQLVAHISQKLALQPVSPLNLLIAQLEFPCVLFPQRLQSILYLPAIGDVTNDGGNAKALVGFHRG